MSLKSVLNGFSILFLIIAVLTQTCAQNTTSSTTSSTTASTTSNIDLPIPPTPFPTPAIVMASSTDMASSTTNNRPVETCCYIQTACHRCKNLYKVNSITYCCPNCLGLVLVTDLRCTCYAPSYTDPSTLNCTKTTEVVGGYQALRPSYYTAGSSALFSEFTVWSVGLAAVVVAASARKR